MIKKMGKPKKSSTPEKEVRSFTVSFIKVDDKIIINIA